LTTSAKERSSRILAEKLRILYQGAFAVPANLAIACVTAYFLRATFPLPLLEVWLAATALVAGARLLLHNRYLRRNPNSEVATRWAPLFCIGSLSSGLLWGGLCVGLPFWGSPSEFVLLTLVAAGMTAGALTTIVTYLPAFLSYSGAFIVPLASVSMLNADRAIAVNGALMVLYMVLIGFAARNLSRSVSRSIELLIDNGILEDSLKETRVERDEARKEKWSTLSQLSHELRTPLNAILGFSEMMREEMFGPLGNVRYKEYAGNVHSSGRHLLTLTEELLLLSQGEAGKLKLDEGDVDLAVVARSCLEILGTAAEKGGLKLRILASSASPLRADETKMRQIILNLVSNAIKFTRPGGEASIEIGRAADGGIDLVVRDTGIGMKPEDIPLALQPFGRLATPLNHQVEGTGLGLPICQRLAELHGATLSIESECGRGTTCTVAFPMSRSLRFDGLTTSAVLLTERIAHVA
jgi:signal transduction histidine kinase